MKRAIDKNDRWVEVKLPKDWGKMITPVEKISLGCSQWKLHGIKYGYDKYFNIKWPKD